MYLITLLELSDLLNINITNKQLLNNIDSLLQILPIVIITLYAPHFFTYQQKQNLLVVIYSILCSLIFKVISSQNLMHILWDTTLFSTKNNLTITNLIFNFSILQFRYDLLSLIFSFTTLSIGIFTTLYSSVYLNGDKNITKFSFFLSFFLLSMLYLVHTNNMVCLLLCWEFLGVSSFFLIGHYSQRPYTLKSALKAFNYNRFSDITFFLFFCFYIINYNTILCDITSINTVKNINILGILLFLTASVKSAQNIFFF